MKLITVAVLAMMLTAALELTACGGGTEPQAIQTTQTSGATPNSKQICRSGKPTVCPK